MSTPTTRSGLATPTLATHHRRVGREAEAGLRRREFGRRVARGPAPASSADVEDFPIWSPDGRVTYRQIVAANDQRIVTVRQIHVVLNWFDELKAKAKP